MAQAAVSSKASKTKAEEAAGTASPSEKTSKHTQESKASKTRKKQDAQKSGVVKGKNQKLGRIGEDMACHYLATNGIEVVERNWTCKCGEADIIAHEDDTLVFIEVKTRSEGFSGLPEYAVTKQKRMRYEKIATSYLEKNQRPSGRVRFDVIAIQMTGTQQCLLRHHRDAFSVDTQ